MLTPVEGLDTGILMCGLSAVVFFAAMSIAFYHSTVNFTTLGYGDMVMNDSRRLLGALEAANGVLMFGLTTGFLYSVLNIFLRRAWDQQKSTTLE